MFVYELVKIKNNTHLWIILKYFLQSTKTGSGADSS